MTERRAMAAERDSTDRYVAAFMQDRVGATFGCAGDRRDAVRPVCAAGRDGRRGAFADARAGYGVFPPRRAQTCAVGDRSGTVYGLGDIVSVRLGRSGAAHRRPAVSIWRQRRSLPLEDTAACGRPCRAANAADERDCFRPGRTRSSAAVAPQGCGDACAGETRGRATRADGSAPYRPRLHGWKIRGFPAGASMPADRRIAVASELRPEVLEKISNRHCGRRGREDWRSPAIRETFEETGVLVANAEKYARVTVRPPGCTSSRQGHPKLGCAGFSSPRGFTPPNRPAALDARFLHGGRVGCCACCGKMPRTKTAQACWLTLAEARAPGCSRYYAARSGGSGGSLVPGSGRGRYYLSEYIRYRAHSLSLISGAGAPPLPPEAPRIGGTSARGLRRVSASKLAVLRSGILPQLRNSRRVRLKKRASKRRGRSAAYRAGDEIQRIEPGHDLVRKKCTQAAERCAAYFSAFADQPPVSSGRSRG